MRISLLIAGIMTLAAAAETFGQLSVQQPVIKSTGGQFAVTVPDRGGVLLGSISRAAESRNSYGFPFSRGSSVGRSAEHTSLSSHVWIHDLREMDRLILEMAETDPSGQQASTTARRVGLAWSEFQTRRGVSVEDRRPTSLRAAEKHHSGRVTYSENGRFRAFSVQSEHYKVPVTSQKEPLEPHRSRALDPVHSYRLGLEAEESGKLTLAKLHYQAAAQYGSEQALLRLREMALQPVASK
jgi:hypothetical protein